MDKRKKNQIKAPAPEAYLYETPKKDKKVTDKDLFVMPSKSKIKTKKGK